jgi:hypothetical protein
MFAALALAGVTAAVSYAVAPYREPVTPTQVVNRVVKDQSRLPAQPLVPRFVRTESYRQVPMPRPRPERRRAHR